MQPRKIFNFLIVILFGIGLWLPIIGNITGIGSSQENLENRELALAPTLKQLQTEGIVAYKSQLERYYNDRFGFRDKLVQWNSWLKYFLFSTSVSSQVIIGKKDWLYFSDEIYYHWRTPPFTEIELQQIKQFLEQRQQWLAIQGIKYLLVIVPNKSTIYPEYLPDYIDQVNRETRADQLVRYLRRHLPQLPIVFLKSSLLKAKTQGQIYYRTDTHWNSDGVAVAIDTTLQAIAALYHPHAIPLPKVPMVIRKSAFFTGDLANMLSLNGILKENRIQREFPQIVREKKNEKELYDRFQLTYEPQIIPGTSLLAGKPILIFGDSFFYGNFDISVGLSRYFSRLINIRTILDFYPNLIAHEKPSLVIQEHVERMLLKPWPANPPEVTDFRGINFQNMKALQYISPFLRATSETGFDGLADFHDIRVSTNVSDTSHPQRFTFNVVGDHSYFALPFYNYPQNDAILLKIVLTSSIKSELKVLYMTQNNPSYSREQTLAFYLNEGENTFYLRIPKSSMTGRIRLEPKAIGRYILHSIEGYSWNELVTYSIQDLNS